MIFCFLFGVLYARFDQIKLGGVGNADDGERVHAKDHATADRLNEPGLVPFDLT